MSKILDRMIVHKPKSMKKESEKQTRSSNKHPCSEQDKFNTAPCNRPDVLRSWPFVVCFERISMNIYMQPLALYYFSIFIFIFIYLFDDVDFWWFCSLSLWASRRIFIKHIVNTYIHTVLSTHTILLKG
jgi:hypothetical protein